MADNKNSIIELVVELILCATLLPLGLGEIANAVLPETTPDAVVTLFQTVLPIMAIIGVVMKFIKTSKD